METDLGRQVPEEDLAPTIYPLGEGLAPTIGSYPPGEGLAPSHWLLSSHYDLLLDSTGAMF